MSRYPLLVVLILVATSVVADDDPPKSKAAAKARDEYEAALKKLEDEYQKKAADQRDKYVEDLDATREAALAAKDLDEAQRVLSAQRAVAEEPALNVALQIVAARFGWKDRWTDVTAAVKKKVRDGELRMKSAGDGLGDPAFGQAKSLVVVYRHKGVLRVAAVGDNSPLVLPGPR